MYLLLVLCNVLFNIYWFYYSRFLISYIDLNHVFGDPKELIGDPPGGPSRDPRVSRDTGPRQSAGRRLYKDVRKLRKFYETK